MQYMGGKSRIATPLAQILNATGGDHSYIELFARNTTPGWDVRGNEVNKYGN